MKIKKGDKVLILTGKDRGKSGNVIKVIQESNKVVVDKINVVKKHSKPRFEGAKGEIIEKPMPISASNVELICPKCNKPSRIGKKFLESGKKVKVCKKCGEEI